MTTISTKSPQAMEAMEKLQIFESTFWKCPCCSVLSTRCAALPKNECTPVAMTTASISPCLHVDPECTSSPGPLVAGRDSPVSADWSIFTASSFTVTLSRSLFSRSRTRCHGRVAMVEFVRARVLRTSKGL
ncbi:hypothetical protein MPTK1_2g09670 [Marchantia polymorpha subsp. ruderalis]|uniref:Uncharacterized protein n=1 Tax=Marchantia polymorpha TaxID=3197 RepID=A0A2R6W480_MARPO|nr:hypothetical protein MARPO_0158s0037 [Marchantia polymorpha]BBN01708.1 hypothetical protein Mp_2g09670 [Marchantia polymorpha subsp. ruderalis]|eukprot:PTQ28660.1 hypothetical protein MARPO_0158s0037 [Marchantia polymorpha]